MNFFSGTMNYLTDLLDRRRVPSSNPPPSPPPPSPEPLSAVAYNISSGDGERDETKVAPSLADYQLVDELGQGGFGTVYLARKRANNRPYALKVMPLTTSQGLQNLPVFLNEVHLLASIEHPFIVQIQCAFSNESNLFMGLELVPGGTLWHLIAKAGPLSLSHARFYVSQIILAIDYLHRENIIFRDLKPENVLIDSEGYVKLTDFGLAKRLKKGRCSLPVGTISYLAPETLFGKPYGVAADWWSLGVLLYFLITAELPFDEPWREPRPPNWKDIVCKKIVAGSYSMPPGLPIQFRKFLDTLLSPDPKRRELTHEVISGLPWFLRIEWDRLLKKSYIPPRKPNQMVLPWNPDEPESLSHEADRTSQDSQQFFPQDYYPKQVADPETFRWEGSSTS